MPSLTSFYGREPIVKPQHLVVEDRTKVSLTTSWQNVGGSITITPQAGFDLLIRFTVSYRISNNVIGIKLQRDGADLWLPGRASDSFLLQNNNATVTEWKTTSLGPYKLVNPGLSSTTFQLQAKLNTGTAIINEDAASPPAPVTILEVQEVYA